MDFRDVVRSGLDEYLEGLEQALDGLTPVELAWQPAPVVQQHHVAGVAHGEGGGPVGQLVP